MLTETDTAILVLESKFWRYQGAKEEAIRSELDLSPARYYQRLLALMGDPEALARAPVTVNRLRRLLVQYR